MRNALTTAAFLTAVAAHAQQPMGTVATHDALVTGGLEVHAERASLVSNASIAAYDRTAPIDLTRGGQILVCATSQFHLLRSGPGPSLLFALDRGAFELRTASQPQDVILTPDLRFTLTTPGTLDLSLRVTPNGDTCVDNTGSKAPTLQVADVFTDATYRLTPGQHVLFEHGSLKEVVDRESSACGCPVESVPQIVTTTPGQPTTPALAEAQHPFPAAVSQGLAPPPLVDNSSPAGEKHTQVSAILNYGTSQPDSTAVSAPPASVPTSASATSATPPPSPPGAHDIFHSIGHFFHKLFHPGS
jgi:hypothetical protein